MRGFRWLGAGVMPASLDLRRLGWRLQAVEPRPVVRSGQGTIWAEPRAEALLLIDGANRQWMRWLLADGTATRRRWALVLGVNDPADRARLLALGVGDVVGTDAPLAEIEERAGRILRHGNDLPAQRRHGPLRLDLLERDGFVGDRPLGLHPREFALLWRLLERPGELVDKAALLRDVWHLRHMPETNSIAVHTSRLRAKLTCFGLGALVQTAPSGGYFVASPGSLADGRQSAGGKGGRSKPASAVMPPHKASEDGVLDSLRNRGRMGAGAPA